jgi:hypothetical protein
MHQAYELRGASKVDEANVVCIWASLCLMSTLDLTAPDAKPIVERLEGMSSALRFVLRNPLEHIRELGYTTTAQCTQVCALAFGKEEGGDCAFYTSVSERLSVH